MLFACSVRIDWSEALLSSAVLAKSSSENEWKKICSEARIEIEARAEEIGTQNGVAIE